MRARGGKHDPASFVVNRKASCEREFLEQSYSYKRLQTLTANPAKERFE
jgi:hypothetical protein